MGVLSGMIREYIIKVDEEKKDIMGNCPLAEKPQELIRCKDCRHYLLPENESRGECMARAGWFPVDADWFCADGVAKDIDVID